MIKNVELPLILAALLSTIGCSNVNVNLDSQSRILITNQQPDLHKCKFLDQINEGQIEKKSLKQALLKQAQEIGGNYLEIISQDNTDIIVNVYKCFYDKRV